MGKGSRRNERKANRKRRDVNQRNETDLRQELKDWLSLPITQRPADYDAQLKLLRGMLKRALGRKRKSETHSRTGKRGR